jgi:hypothetical protein
LALKSGVTRRAMLLVWFAVDEIAHVSREQEIDNPHTDRLESRCQTQQWAKRTPTYVLPMSDLAPV